MRMRRRITSADRRRVRGALRRIVTVSSKGTSFFNDMLGTTVGAKSGRKYSAATLSAFGARELEKGVGVGERRENLFFTGKPEVAGLGYAFLMRNYRAGLGKWQTADPMGYPDGWNQLAYCGNGVTGAVDLWGCKWVLYYSDDWYDYGVESPTDLTVRNYSQDFTGSMDWLALMSDPEMGLVFRVVKGEKTTGTVDGKETSHLVTFDSERKHKFETWESWSERYDTTPYYVEVLADSTIKTVADMLSVVGGAFSALGKVGKVVKVAGKVIDASADLGTDIGLVSLLGNLFDEHKVLFTYDLGTKTEYLRTAKQHHLRSFVKE